MHSISTRATVHGRRRNLKRLGVTAAGVIGATGLVAGVAFGAPAFGTITVVPSSDNVVVGGPSFNELVSIQNTGTDGHLTTLFLATACTLEPGTAPTTASSTLCTTGDAGLFTLGPVTIDPASLATNACTPAQAAPTITNAGESNVNLTWPNLLGPDIHGTSTCQLDVTLTPIGSVPSAGVMINFLANAELTDGSGATGTIFGATNAFAPETVLPGTAVTTTPTSPPAHSDDRHVSDRRDDRRHESHRCTPDTPNNGNGNLGYGNNGNGNVGNCNNGNGNTGDDNSGNGNGDRGHDHDGDGDI